MVRERQSAVPLEEAAWTHGEACPAGWSPDPAGHAGTRYWDGSAWTGWVSDGVDVRWDEVVPGPDEREQQMLAYLRHYLVGATARGVIPADAAAALDADAASWQQVPALPAPTAVVDAVVPATWNPPDETVVPPQPAPASPLAGTAAPAAARAPSEPSGPTGPTVRARAVAWLRRSARALSAELAVHGLADVGALLVFVGLFGFVAFAFGEVRAGLRPLAEVALPVVVLGTGAFLRRRGTRTVGNVLVVLGGALLPVVLVASFSDGAAPPPDLDGAALVGALVASMLAVAGVEALLVRRSPDSPVRYLVAPTCWLAVAAAGLGLGRAVPSGSDLATPMPLQWALVAVAVVATVALGRLRPRGPWARAADVTAGPALVLAYGLTMLSAGREGWSPWPVLLAAVALLLGVELLVGARQRVLVAVGELVVVVGTAAALAQSWPAPWVAAGVTVALLALAESARRHGAPRPVVLAGVGAAAVAAYSAGIDLRVDPAGAAAAAGVLWVWVASQSLWPTTLGPRWTRAGAWVLPVLFVDALHNATSASTATFVMGCVVAAVVAVLVAVPRARKDPWTWWVLVAGGAVALSVLAQLSGVTWWTVAAAAVVSLACAVSPVRRSESRGVAVGAAVITVVAAVELLGWAPEDLAPWAVGVMGAGTLAASLALVGRRLSRTGWLWAVAVAGGIQLVGVLSWLATGSGVPLGLLVVGGTAATAAGLGLAAVPTGWWLTRHASAVVGSCSVLLLAAALDAPMAVVAAVAAGVVLVASLARTLLRLGGRGTAWRQPMSEVVLLALASGLAAATQAGPGWTGLVLVAASAAAVLHSVGTDGPGRLGYQLGTVVTAGGAWWSLSDWQGWSVTSAVAATAVLGAAVMLVAAVVTWVRRVPRDWATVGVASGMLPLLGAAVQLTAEGVDRAVAGPWVAGALLGGAVAAGALVRPTGWDGWRVVSVVMGLGAVAVLLDAVGADADQLLAVSVTVGLLGTAGMVAISLFERGRSWLLSVEGVAVAGLAGAAVAGPAVGSRGVALLLLLLGTELLAVGAVRDLPPLLFLSPVALCASWLVLVSEVVDRGPSWFTVPVGATVLATVELARRQRRRRGLPASARPLVVVEVLGTALLVVAPLVEVVRTGPLHVVTAVALGVALGLWGTLTRVRRRLVAGAATVVVAVLLLVVVPMVDLARRAGGPVVWLLVAGAGLVAIGVAAAVERRRRDAARGSGRLADAVRGWE